MAEAQGQRPPRGAAGPRPGPGTRGSVVAFMGITGLVTIGAMAIFVVLDPRTLPWLGGQIATAWSALVSYVSSLRPQ